MNKDKFHFMAFAFWAFFIFAALADGYVQHVPGDVSDSRQNFPLRVARGETVDLSIDFFDDGEPLDITGANVTLHTRTNGMDAAESWQTAGTATNNSALFVLDVDAVLPQAAGQWSCVASRDGRTLARLGGPAYVRGTAAGSAAALPQNALAGYATTNYVAGAIAAIPLPPPETDPTVPDWAKAENPPLSVESDPVFAEWVDTITNLYGWVQQSVEAYHAQWAEEATVAYEVWDRDARHHYHATDIFKRDTAVAQAATNYTDSAILAATNALDFSESDPVWEAEKAGYATSADLAAVEASASLVGLLLQGSNVVAEVTNYNSRVHAPELRLLQLSESNEYYQVWAETNGLARTLAGAIEHADGATNALDAAKADRAWSHHTSGLGADAPDGYTWMSTPNTVLAGGLEFEKHVTTGGAIWILKSNGMSADFHAQTNNAAFLDLSSADGTPVFRVEKTDSYLVGVDVTSLSVSGDTLICGVNAIAAEHPLARVRPSLSTGDWIREEDGIPASLATVRWSGSSGAWVCEITNNSGGNSFFATMEYLQEGGTKIINSAPLDVSQGILCTDGVHRVRPVYSNGSVTWQVMQ